MMSLLYVCKNDVSYIILMICIKKNKKHDDILSDVMSEYL